jgi:hypothetical protein
MFIEKLRKCGKMKGINLLIILAVVLGVLIFTANGMAKVIEVTVTVDPTSFAGDQAKTFLFTGKITTDSSDMVSYGWKRSDGAIHPLKTVEFTRAGTKEFAYSWTVGTDGKSYSGWVVLETKSPNNMISNQASFTFKWLMQRQEKPLPVDRVRTAPLKKEQSAMNCPDPAAYDIRFQLVKRTDKFRGQVRITGIVKNIGRKSFKPGPKQATAYLYEMPPGTSTGGMLLAQTAIRNLIPGETLLLIYERDWNSSTSSEGKLPPTYRLEISFNTDLYKDTNPDNDDCSQMNNKKERSGSEINNMFRK